MAVSTDPIQPTGSGGRPTLDSRPTPGEDLEARSWAVAEEYLGDLDDRWMRHGPAVIARARQIQRYFGPDGEILVAAAILHDIGVSPRAPQHGIKGLNAGRLLTDLGFPARVVNLVANASCASVEADLRGLSGQFEEFPDEGGPLRDALIYCCLTYGTDGLPRTIAERERELLDRFRMDPLMLEFMALVRDTLFDAVRRTEARITLSPRVLERTLAIPGLNNIRDLGGLPAGDRQVRKGVLFRSDAPVGLSGASIEMLAEVGLRTTIDLRLPESAEFQPTSLPDGVVRLSYPVPPPVDADGDGLVEQILSGKVVEHTVESVADFYLDLLRTNAPVFGAAVAAIADPSNRPCMIHCAAGKDRTGLLVAIVLEAVGVPRAAIVEDYAATTVLGAPRAESYRKLLEDAGTTWERVAPLFLAPPPALDQTLQSIGSAADYLVDECGVAPETLDRLRDALTDGQGTMNNGLRNEWRSVDD